MVFFFSYLPESCGFFYPLSLSPAVFSSHCLGVLWFFFPYLPESCGFFYPLSLSPAVFSSHCLGVLCFFSYLPESCGFFYPLSLSPAVFSSHCLGVLWFLFSHSTKVLRFLWDTIQQLSHIFSFCGVLWSHRK